MTNEIKIERGIEVKPGIFKYRIVSLGIEGQSRQPLLDACRQIKLTLADTKDKIAAIYREGNTYWDMSCPVDQGTQVTTVEPDKGRVRFIKYQAFDWNNKERD